MKDFNISGIILIVKKFYILLALLVLAGLFYWFQWRPSQIRKSCYKEQLSKIQERHDQNLNYYFVGEPATKIDDVDKNRPMYVRDLNARLDRYWADLAYEDCLRRNGLK